MKVCQHCGTKNPDVAAFCSECGKQLPTQAAPKAPMKTMLSTPAPVIPQEKKEAPAPSPAPAPAPAQASKPIASVPDSKKTIMGMPSMATGQQAAPAAQAAPTPAAHAARAKAPEPALPPDKAKKAAQEAAGKTMLGVSPLASSASTKQPGASQLQYQKTMQEEKPVFEPVIDTPVISPSRVPAAPQQQPQAQPQPRQRPADARPRSEAPAEGFLISEPPQPAPSMRARPPASSEPPPRPSRIGSTTMLMMRRAAAVPRWLIAVIIIVVVGGAGLGFAIKKFVLEPLKPRVTKIVMRQNPNFTSLDLDIEMINVEKIMALKIMDQKFDVKGSKSTVNLPIGPVRLGDNAIEAVLLDAGGKEKGTMMIEFELTKYWQPQTQTLDEANPVVGLFFQTLPDAQLLVNGEPSPGEGPGKFLYQKTVKQLMEKFPPATGDVWKLSFDYELKSKGRKPEKGTVGIEIPVVSLIVDRPADGARVVEDKVECMGRTELEAEIKINGSPVDVNNGKFATTVPLAEVKTYTITIEAYSPKRGPKVSTVKVERVADMSAEIAAYEKDVEKDLSWEKLAREPTSYTGKKVAFEGRIFNIRTEKGVTAFQMLVSEGCPAGARCTLVATYRGETSAGEQSLVKILGEVRGIQTLQTAAGSKFDAPQLEVQYVLPLEEKKGKK
jgi:hypothetical protein